MRRTLHTADDRFAVTNRSNLLCPTGLQPGLQPVVPEGGPEPLGEGGPPQPLDNAGALGADPNRNVEVVQGPNQPDPPNNGETLSRG